MAHIILSDGNAEEVMDLLDRHGIDSDYIDDRRILIDMADIELFEEVMDQAGLDYDYA